MTREKKIKDIMRIQKKVLKLRPEMRATYQLLNELNDKMLEQVHNLAKKDDKLGKSNTDYNRIKPPHPEFIEYQKEVGKRVQWAIKCKGVMLSNLAKDMCSNTTVIRSIMDGKSKSFNTLANLAHSLGTPIVQFLDGITSVKASPTPGVARRCVINTVNEIRAKDPALKNSTEFGRRCDLSMDTINRIVNLDCKLNTETLWKLARGCNVTPGFFLMALETGK